MVCLKHKTPDRPTDSDPTVVIGNAPAAAAMPKTDIMIDLMWMDRCLEQQKLLDHGHASCWWKSLQIPLWADLGRNRRDVWTHAAPVVPLLPSSTGGAPLLDHIEKWTSIALLLCALAPPALAQDPILIRAGTLIDGKGGVERNVIVTIEGGRIAKVAPASATASRETYDLQKLTLLPGFIDTHVHFNYRFGTDGRFAPGEEPPARLALYSAENAY